MKQFIVKDGHGKAVLSHNKVPSYAYLAREVTAANAVRPVTVWQHDTLKGSHHYDSERTRKLSGALVRQTKVPSMKDKRYKGFVIYGRGADFYVRKDKGTCIYCGWSLADCKRWIDRHIDETAAA